MSRSRHLTLTKRLKYRDSVLYLQDIVGRGSCGGWRLGGGSWFHPFLEGNIWLEICLSLVSGTKILLQSARFSLVPAVGPYSDGSLRDDGRSDELGSVIHTELDCVWPHPVVLPDTSPVLRSNHLQYNVWHWLLVVRVLLWTDSSCRVWWWYRGCLCACLSSLRWRMTPQVPPHSSTLSGSSRHTWSSAPCPRSPSPCPPPSGRCCPPRWPRWAWCWSEITQMLTCRPDLSRK